MSPAHVFEPTYEAIKRRLMTGEWPSGMRLEAARLAEHLGVSVTPVRDCLYRLNGKRLVDFTPGEGFHVHRLTETGFRDLLELHLILLLAALATAPHGSVLRSPSSQIYPDRASGLFLTAASRSANTEIVAAIAEIGDRLHLTRHFDAAVLADIELELDAIEEAILDGAPQAQTRNLLLGYHERRAHEAATYARLLSGHPGRRSE